MSATTTATATPTVEPAPATPLWRSTVCAGIIAATVALTALSIVPDPTPTPPSPSRPPSWRPTSWPRR